MLLLCNFLYLNSRENKIEQSKPADDFAGRVYYAIDANTIPNLWTHSSDYQLRLTPVLYTTRQYSAKEFIALH